MKEFNTTAVCIPSKHYMVDITDKVQAIRKLVDAGKYFTINRARQYGKTTTLTALDHALAADYDVISLDYQDMTDAAYATESGFVKALALMLCDARDTMGASVPDHAYEALQALSSADKDLLLSDLFRVIDKWCRENEKPLVLIIDEIDSAANTQAFLDFLGKLRSNYIKREKNPNFRTFQSVILAGVTDIKHLKAKIRPDEFVRQNSPWNIAADFNVDMSLSEPGIRGMLDAYENDHHTGMDTADMAKQIHDYTSGYPFLVSRICQLIDTVVCENMAPAEAWSRTGLDEAIKLILAEKNTLFETLTKNLNNYPELKAALRRVLMEGDRLPFNTDQGQVALMDMYGLIRNDRGVIKIANRIFETRLYNLFLSDDEMKSNVFYTISALEKNRFVQDGKLNMRLILERFIATYTEVLGPLENKFKEKDGRELFLLYLKPIINGTGNYYIEAQTRDMTRTDIIVDYLGQRYIIELKIWRGERYNAEGEQQLREYLDYFQLDMGYMLSFNFNKNKRQGVEQVQVGDKILIEAML